MNTLRLDTTTWDLTLTTYGDIYIAKGPYAIAQDVASAVRLFLGELWYDTSQGLPYFTLILGKLPSLQFMKSKFIAAGLTVPGTVSIKCFLTGPPKGTRELGGQMQIVDDRGQLSVLTTGAFGAEPWYFNAADVGINEG